MDSVQPHRGQPDGQTIGEHLDDEAHLLILPRSTSAWPGMLGQWPPSHPYRPAPMIASKLALPGPTMTTPVPRRCGYVRHWRPCPGTYRAAVALIPQCSNSPPTSYPDPCC